MNGIIAQTTAINESFETWPAPDWNIYQMGQGGNWLHSSLWGADLGYLGGNCAKIQISNDPADNWLVSPQISVINGDYSLTFYENSKDLQYYVYAGVYVSTGSGNPANNDFVAVSESLKVEDMWVEHIVDLSAYIGDNIYIAFAYEGTWTHWDIDEVVVSPSSLIDAALTEIINPIGINPNTGIEDIIVTLHNFGTGPIVDIDIEWYVDDIQQSTYTGMSLNLAPGDDVNLTIGQYNFSTLGDYNIQINHLLSGDANPSNDSIETTYYVNDPKDAELVNVIPNGYMPVAGTRDVVVTVLNNGNYIIEDITVEWEVDGISQTNYQAIAINLEPGDEVDLTIGTYGFIDGLNVLDCNVIISADEDLSNNSKTNYIAVNLLWESFELNVFPPEMWKAKDYPMRDNFWPPPHGEFYYSSQTDNNMFGEISDTLWTPLLNISTGNSINFWVNNSAYFTNDDKLIFKDGTTGDIFEIGDINSTLEQWDEVVMDISSAAGVNYIGFVNNNNGSFGYSSLDKITSDASIYHFDYDLGVKSLQFDYLAKINESHSFNVDVRNYGVNQVQGSSYSVKIVDEEDNLIAEETGVTLLSWEEAVIEINYTFTEEEVQKVLAVITYTADQQTDNNTSVEYSIYSVPANIVLNDVGFPEVENPNIPFNTGGNTMSLGEDDLSQHIYYQDELNMEGYLYGVTLYYHELFGVGQDLPLEVRLKETDLVDLTGGWIPQEEMQVVFSDTITVYPGHNSVYIPFIEPILITGTSNLAIQYYQYDPSWPATACRFLSTNDPSGPVRAIRLSDVYDLEPNDPPNYWGEHTDYTYTSFVFQPIDGGGIISGSVFDENNDTIQWATITVEGTSIVENTGETGIYTLPSLPYETYEVTASYLAYNDSTKVIELNQPNETLDFHLTLLPVVSVTGDLVGSNDITVPLEGVLVTLHDLLLQTTSTDATGMFEFETVYGNDEYEITFELHGYHNLMDSIFVVDNDINMGQVIMLEENISAYNIAVVPGTDQNIVLWEDPATSKNVKYQNDLGVESYSFTNEPYEDVWLGNRFTNFEPITITSVEILWDIYENAHDFVTIDILDDEGNVLVSSEPIETFNDSLMTIDVPNITIDESFYAMVHWKDNPESTDAITVDMSEYVPNTACIKYPGSAPELLSDFLGNPPASFFVRVQTLEENTSKQNREVLSYNIYRGLADEIGNSETWISLNDEPIYGTTYADFTWDNDPNTFTYSIEAVYTDENAELTFSKFFSGTTNVSETTNESFSVYPNPASSSINIAGIKDTKIDILNILGEVILTDNIVSGEIKLDISHLENGIYLIKIQSENGELVEKLIVSK